jgi:hypothetical protein
LLGLRRLAIASLVLLLGACTSEDPYTGEPFAKTKAGAEKPHVGPRGPTRAELASRPAPDYVQQLRAEDAKAQRLEVPSDVRASTLYLNDGDRATLNAVGPGYGPKHDPWESYEADRRAVLVRPWSDTGTPEAPAVEPKKERPVEDDPYAPAPRVGKKDDAGAGAEKPEGEGEKKPEGEGEKKPEPGER